MIIDSADYAAVYAAILLILFFMIPWLHARREKQKEVTTN